MSKNKTLLFCIAVELCLIVSIAIANIFQGIAYAVFYNLLYGLILSVVLPLILLLKNKEDFSSVGFKKLGKRQIIVLLAFVIFSVGGQLIPKIIAGATIAWQLLPGCFAPLVMTTFFEEFLFRGFIQTRVEKHFGSLVAILVSGLMFSLYHLGYPGFRNIGDLLLLFVVGLGFALAYKLSNNNLIVAYFVNLPNAFLTYILKSQQFPKFSDSTSIYAAITIILIILSFVIVKKKIRGYKNDQLN